MNLILHEHQCFTDRVKSFVAYTNLLIAQERRLPSVSINYVLSDIQ